MVETYKAWGGSLYLYNFHVIFMRKNRHLWLSLGQGPLLGLANIILIDTTNLSDYQSHALINAIFYQYHRKDSYGGHNTTLLHIIRKNLEDWFGKGADPLYPNPPMYGNQQWQQYFALSPNWHSLRNKFLFYHDLPFDPSSHIRLVGYL